MRDVTLKINGKKFDSFRAFNVTLRYNSIASQFTFEGYYDPSNLAQKELFKPLSFHEVQIYYDDILFLTGETLSTSTSASGTSSLANISGYSLPGVLEDCPIPLDLYPIQYDNLNLIEITQKFANKFGISVSVDSAIRSEASKKYPKMNSENFQSIKNLLTDLAGQRNIILSHDVRGRLVLTRPNVKNRSVATYEENVPATKISLSVNGQEMHSKITAMKQASIGTDVAGESSVTNLLISRYRPTIKQQDNGTNDDTLSFAKKSRGSELRGIKLIIETDRWQWYDGRRLHLIQPNSLIDVISPSNFIKNRTRFFVEEVAFEGTTGINKATLTCVLPECYTGEAPKIRFA